LRVYDKDFICEQVKGKIERYFGCTIEEATDEQKYAAISMTVRDQIMEKWTASRQRRHRQKSRRLYYLSVEFLMGRALNNNVINLLETEAYAAACKEMGIRPDDISETEPDPGLGNGGLGRLAACFLDSIATLNLPAMGCSIRYEYGLFKQKIVNGEQVEMPDNWLENGNIWEVPVPAEAKEIHFGGRVEFDDTVNPPKAHHLDYTTVIAMPYDMPCIGYDTDIVVPLRLWSARAPKRLDMAKFNSGDFARANDELDTAEAISKVLYPDDNHYTGRELRLKQHYFFTSATIQYIIANYKKYVGGDIRHLDEKVMIHINDTHPGLAIPELMRILIDEEGLGWDEAEVIVRRTFAYTNHTIMAEALERWPEEMVQRVLPRVYGILKEMNERWCRSLWTYYPGQWDRIGSMAILAYGQLHMANLCCAYSFSVNGVSQLHADILKKNTFKDFVLVNPKMYSGITNGITHRRWLMLANPRLMKLLNESIGEAWIRDPERLEDLLPFAKDAAFLEKFAEIKRKNKEWFAHWLKRSQGVDMDIDTLFDVQAKRLHEYKRQLLNVLHILYLYQKLEEDSSFEMVPRTFIFGAKAAPGYHRAKLIIRLINAVADMVKRNPRASRYINVVFIENYGVTTAEHLMPAANVSEQLSTAGKEASGTGNMKFMMNGAVTVGTMDGANIEIAERVGEDNIYIFGLRSEEVDDLYAHNSYMAGEIYEQSPALRRVLDKLIDGSILPQEPRAFAELYHELLFGDFGGMADPYLVLKDFADYARAQALIDRDYRAGNLFMEKCVVNTAMSGYFSSDRTIRDYNESIWRLSPISPV
jgi:starch phosphorylase